MTNYSQHTNTRNTSQLDQASPNQKKNNAGGYSFVIDPWDKLDRFLILGTSEGTYYSSEKELTIENATAIANLIKSNGVRVVNRCVEISTQGRAHKNEPAIFVLAMCASSDNQLVRSTAYNNIHKVCRIGTHMFHFARDIKAMRGWSRGLRTAVSNWYLNRPVESLALQVVKYQQRDGWSNRDLLRLSHPSTKDKNKNATLAWVVAQAEKDIDKSSKLRSKITNADLPDLILAFEEVQKSSDINKVISLIEKYNLPREALQTEHLNNKDVWQALLPGMGVTALVRNLGKMTSMGLISQGSDASKLVASKLSDNDFLSRGKIHPMSILTALKVYSRNSGIKGSLTWSSVPQIVDALDEAFYASFDLIEPTGKDIVLALDVSASMGWSTVSGSPLTPREASAAMAMVTARTEKDYSIISFSGQVSGVTELNISPKQRLENVIDSISNLPFGGTDCSLPMIWAQKNSIKADAFFVYTDNDTWSGAIHPHQALRSYRNFSNTFAKMVVVGMTSTDFTIADPNDAGMMDVVGFDTSVPKIMSDFIR